MLALLVGFGAPLIASADDSPCSSAISAERRGSDDPPWDPGDEIAPLVKSPDVLMARKGDQPWDPGDESGRRMEVRHVRT